ncbi:MAG: aerotolerance regulator BatC [Bacteroidetes bacterium]|nr:MAG: aerotolerance regulator BatC [Bacteroidota bacterium]RLD96097.1 MAG: aerotolerance regulator BatC [Bacteroidota bacterium]RLE02985.1 MAG: aerotolerance regulator BatC [Bacteroidota bacterium]
MKRSVLILMVLMGMGITSAYGQNERKVIRDGVRAYEDGEFGEAEVQFRKAENINQESYEAEFNTGVALYGQEKYEETVKQYQALLDQTDDAGKTAQIWHNIGNSLLEAQQYAPSIESYKNSLRLNPSDEDTRYNLAYAKQKLKEEQQQQQQNQDQNKDQDQQDQDKDQDQQDQDKDQDQQDQDKDQDQDQQEQQPVPREISREDAERMLKAIQQQEKDVKEKVDKEKAAAAKVKTEKDW